ncbi:MAG: hypothetical protein Q4C95_04115 [Planctomycetia bacterium]|nr:hypothetical protein [Planctomycetia bacterium]
MRVFIAGIMQGSRKEKSLHSQNYRQEISEIFLKAFPEAEIYDPYAKNQNSLNYGDETGKETFLRHNKMCSTGIDVLIAYVPEASMGTAIEIWEAWKNGATILTISPLTKNWVVRYLSEAIYPDIETFADSLKDWKIDGDKLVKRI